MINLTVEIKSGQIVRKGLENLATAIPEISRQRIYFAVKRISTRMRNEAPPPVQGYARTGTYQEGWPVNPSRVGDIGYMIENPVAHAMYVVGDAEGVGQIHKHWVSFQEIIEQELGGDGGKVASNLEQSIIGIAGPMLRYGAVAIGLATGGSLLGALFM